MSRGVIDQALAYIGDMDELHVERITFPNFNMPAGSLGSYATRVTVDCTKSGYTFLGCICESIPSPGAYCCVLSAANNTAYAWIYRAQTSALNETNHIYAYAVWKKNK